MERFRRRTWPRESNVATVSSSRLLNELIPLFSFLLAWIDARWWGGTPWNGIWKSTHLPYDVKEWVSMSKRDYVGTLRKGGGVRSWIYELPPACSWPDNTRFRTIVIAQRRTRGYLLSSSDSIDRQAEITVAVRWAGSRLRSFILIAACFVIGTSLLLESS